MSAVEAAYEAAEEFYTRTGYQPSELRLRVPTLFGLRVKIDDTLGEDVVEARLDLS